MHKIFPKFPYFVGDGPIKVMANIFFEEFWDTSQLIKLINTNHNNYPRFIYWVLAHVANDDQQFWE
jgi:hypothetical protein